jgi:hypothetical protein
MPQNIPAAKRRNYALAENVSFPFHAEPTHPDVRENAMKTFLVMMTLIFSAGLEALQANAQNVDASAKVLITLTNEWTAAINRKDRAKLDEIMSKDFAKYAWDGSEGTPRLEWLDNCQELLNSIPFQMHDDLAESFPQFFHLGFQPPFGPFDFDLRGCSNVTFREA